MNVIFQQFQQQRLYISSFQILTVTIKILFISANTQAKMYQDASTFMKQLSFGAVTIDKIANQMINKVSLVEITADKKSNLARYYTGLHCSKISFKNKCGTLIRIFLLTTKNIKEPKIASSCSFSPDEILKRYYLLKIFELSKIKIVLSFKKSEMMKGSPVLTHIISEMEDFFGNRQTLLDNTSLLIKDDQPTSKQTTQSWMEFSKNCCSFLQNLIENNRRVIIKSCPSWELKHANLVRQQFKKQPSLNLKQSPLIQLTKQSLQKLDQCNNYYLKQLQEVGQALFKLIQSIQKRNQHTQQQLLHKLVKIGQSTTKNPGEATKFMDYLLLYFNVPANWKSQFYIIIGQINILSKISQKYAWTQEHSKMLHIDQYSEMLKEYIFLECQVQIQSKPLNFWQKFQNCLINLL